MPDPLSFLAGGGEAARMIRERDWSGHPLGRPEIWPDAFRSALSLVLNSPESMILAWGPDLSFFFNDTYFPLLGPRLPWAMGERFDKVWADGWEQAKPIIDAAFAGESRRFVDLPWKLGTDRGAADTWWSFSYSRVLGPDGGTAGLFIFTNETTDRVLGEAALKESQNRLEAAMRELSELNATLALQVEERTRDRNRLWELSSDIMLRCGFDGRILAVNPAWTDVLGWREDELVGRTVFEFVHPDDLGRTESGVETLSGGRAYKRFENRYRHRDGSYRWITWSAVPDESAINAVGRDATAERAAAQERDRTWALSPVLKMVVGVDGTVLTVNPGFTKALGWTEDDAVGRPVTDFLPPEEREASAARRARLASGETLGEYRIPLLAKGGGQRRIAWTTVFENGVVFAFGRDVTIETEQAEALARSEEQLRQSQKMEAVGQLTGGLAHDFNNLLAGISGSLELMEARIAQGRTAELERYIAAAGGAAKRAAALTHRLLAFSRRQTLEPKPTDVNRLVAGMEELVRRTVGPEIAVETVAAPSLWSTLVDPNQLENALLNLCINARDAMPDGGRVVIETGNHRFDARGAGERDMAPGEYVSMSVSDNGTGMAPDVVERAFDPFFTTKPIGVGTGLGLSMIYGFAKQSGGQVRIHSNLGCGTTVSLYLPRHAAAGEPADGGEAAQPVLAANEGRGETVLVIDDEPLVRMLVVDVLEELGYAAIEAGDGPSGLKVLQSDARIDLLVTDVGLPNGMNGRQVADAARALRPGLKVLFVTGYAENAVLSHGHLDPGMHIVTKPFTMTGLAAKIKTLIAADG